MWKGMRPDVALFAVAIKRSFDLGRRNRHTVKTLAVSRASPPRIAVPSLHASKTSLCNKP
jgi:hypothetical protein